MAVSKLNQGFVEKYFSEYTDFFAPAPGVSIVNCTVRQLDNNVFDIRLNINLTEDLAAGQSKTVGSLSPAYFGKTSLGGNITTVVSGTNTQSRVGIFAIAGSGSISLINTSELSINSCRQTNGIFFST